MRIILSFIILLVIPALAASATLEVPGQYPTIQDAIDAASGGDTVLVAPGTYVENIDFKAKAVTVTSLDGAGVTIIDGGNPAVPDFGSVALFQSGEGPDSVLEGFTLTNGTGTLDPSVGLHYGGAVCCIFDSSPTLRKNIIVNNSANDDGGAIYCYSHCSPVISSNLICGNSADGAGGGICCKIGSSPVFASNTLYGNSAKVSGGAIYCYQSDWNLSNLILWNNDAPTGPEIFIGSSSNPSTFAISYSSVQGGQASIHVEANCTLIWGAGMIDADPLFVDPQSGDFHLMQHPCQVGVANPCVGSGDPAAAVFKGTTRTDGVQDEEVVDMGYHYPEKYHDQDKLVLAPGLGFYLWYSDVNQNGWHDPGEELYTAPASSGHEDWSCWMAAASNLMAFLGYANPYYTWIKHGGAPSPSYDLNNNQPAYAPGGGSHRTFDEGGWSEWPMRQEGLTYETILSTNMWTGAVWAQDPIAWCQQKLDDGRPVVLMVYSNLDGDGRGADLFTGYNPRNRYISHVITLWEIDSVNQFLTITDSDDAIDGPRKLFYTWKDNKWTLMNIYPEWREVSINGACCFLRNLISDDQLLFVDQGGTIGFDLQAGYAKEGRDYLLLATLSGSHPGTKLPGGGILPLNWDLFTGLTIANINTMYFSNFSGTLDANGSALADFYVPPYGLSALLYENLNFAYVLAGPMNFASDPVRVQIVQ